jgi:hypothetical protein
LAVVLDVVYNHLGPEGNYMRDFGPYFTDWYRTPWGAAINFDGPRRWPLVGKDTHVGDRPIDQPHVFGLDGRNQHVVLGGVEQVIVTVRKRYV